MKPIIKFTIFFCIAGLAFFSCKKEKAVTSPPITYNNKPPVANAGADVALMLACSQKTGFVALDGSSSTDPDNNIARYNWALLYGPQGAILRDPNSTKVTVENLSLGVYALELTVTDFGGLSSKDTVFVSVNSGPPTEYDLDISLDTTFHFLDNVFDPWDYAPYNYDETYMRGIKIIQPFGEFRIDVFEFADSAALSDSLYATNLEIVDNSPNPSVYIYGSLSGINFKKLIRQSGGSFSGTCTVYDGSARYCDANVFANLPPLIVTGSLDVTTHTVTLSIKGKVYF